MYKRPMDHFRYASDEAEIDNLIEDICLYLNNSVLPDVCNASSKNSSFPSITPRVDGGDAPPEGSAESDEDIFFNEMGLSLANKIILSLLYCVILATALLGNSLVLITVAFKRSLWKPMHIFISSLAISDVVLGLSCIPINVALILTTEWTLGTVTCRSVPFFMNLGSNCSMLTLCCMAAERFMAIVHPIKFNAVHTLGKTLLVLLVVWLVAIATSSPFALYYHPSELCGRYSPSGECVKYHKVCFTNSEGFAELDNLHWLSFLILFILPAFVMVAAYSIIIYHLWIKRSSLTMLSISTMRTSLKKKAVKMLVLVVVLYLVCWSPLLAFTLTVKESDSIRASSVVGLKYYLECLALSSTAYNPIVYAFLNQTFRNNFLAVLLRRPHRVAPQSTGRDCLAAAPVFKTASSNGDAGYSFHGGSKSENFQSSRQSKITTI